MNLNNYVILIYDSHLNGKMHNKWQQLQHFESILLPQAIQKQRRGMVTLKPLVDDGEFTLIYFYVVVMKEALRVQSMCLSMNYKKITSCFVLYTSLDMCHSRLLQLSIWINVMGWTQPHTPMQSYAHHVHIIHPCNHMHGRPCPCS